MSDKAIRPRVPWVALALSLAAAGVGQIYCGQIVKGLLIFCAWFALPLAFVLAAVLPASNTVLLVLILIPVCGLLLLHLYSIVAAWSRARRFGDAYTPKEFNRGVVYAVLISMGLVYQLGTLTAVRQFVFEAFLIPTHNMSPNVLAGDRLLANKLTARGHFPHRGALVLFRNPGPEGGIYIKRVVALAGDQVEMRDNQLWINGKRLARDPVPPEQLVAIRPQCDGEVFEEENAGRRYRIMLGDPPDAPAELGSFPATVVPPRSLFVLGDNRDRSRDSRHFGFVHLGDIVGYPQYLYYPALDWSRFGKVEG